MTYRFRFHVKNPTDETLRVKIQLESPSPILVFQEAKSKHMSKSRLYAKITSLGRAREQKISPGQEKTFDFPADYTPYLTRNLPSVLVLYFGIFVFDLKDQIKMRIGPRKIKLPISEQGSKTVSVDDYVL